MQNLEEAQKLLRYKMIKTVLIWESYKKLIMQNETLDRSEGSLKSHITLKFQGQFQ